VIPFVLKLQTPLFHLPFPDPDHHAKPGSDLGISMQNLILIIGGVFLIGKSTHEIHHKLEGDDHLEDDPTKRQSGSASFGKVMIEIMILNIVFSLDSIITAIGMIPPSQVMVMMLAVLISTGIMAFTVNPVSNFVEKHPTVKMLALSFLIMIGMNLVVEGFHVEIPSGYTYFAMGFSVFVEILNIRSTKKKNCVPVELIEPQL
jgi:predicted tellurium resistance membrane protein TerC